MERLSRFEKARIISARALQLSLGAPPLVKAEETDTPYVLSKKELSFAKLPFVILRKYPSGTIKRISLS